jgi:DNA-binding beta-propeller fold protein YncE
MRRFLALLIALLAIAGAAGCSKRARVNPFDPDNPTTGGRPAGFVALAGNASVELRWSAATGTSVRGFQLFRQVAGESTFTALTGIVPPSSTGVYDFGLKNGVDHRYRLYFVFDEGLGPRPTEDIATPGTQRPWVADGTRHSLMLLTADCRHVALEDPRFEGPTSVASDNGTGAVWVSDELGKSVQLYDPVTLTLTSFTSVSSPTGLLVDPINHTVWVCDQGLNALRHFDPSGGFGTPPQIIPINAPLDVARDAGSRVLWVCERGDNRIGAYSAAGVFAGAVAVDAPSRLAVDSLTHEAWVTSFQRGQVVRISNAPAAVDTIAGFSGPIGIAIDWRRGRIWVADAFGNQVVALRRDGTVEFRIAGIPEAREIDVDLPSGEAWVTAPGNGSVYRLSPAGVVLQHLGGLSSPDGISLGVP